MYTAENKWLFHVILGTHQTHRKYNVKLHLLSVDNLPGTSDRQNWSEKFTWKTYKFEWDLIPGLASERRVGYLSVILQFIFCCVHTAFHLPLYT